MTDAWTLQDLPQGWTYTPTPATPDYTAHFNTELSPGQESSFQQWMGDQSKATGRDVAQDLKDYDLRGWYRENMGADLSGGHLTDQYKKPNHPTFSDQSMYSGAGALGAGHWDQQPGGSWNFAPGSGSMWSPADLQRYFDKYEPGNRLIPVEHDPFSANAENLPFGRDGGPGQGGIRMGAGDMLALMDRAMSPGASMVSPIAPSTLMSLPQSLMRGVGAIGSSIAEAGRPVGEIAHNLYYGNPVSSAEMVRAAGEQAINVPGLPEGIGTGIGKAILGGIAGRMLPHEEQNLNLARILLSRGADEGKIWRMTGWYKHPTDQKWRREISGNNFEINPDFLDSLQKLPQDYREWMEATAKGEVSPGELKKMFLDKNADRLASIKQTGKVSDFVNFPELFQVYPQLADMKMVIDPMMHDSRGGFLPNPREVGEISLNPGFSQDKDQLKLTIGHELQHAVQQIERFPSGSNPILVKKAIGDAFKAKHQDIIQRLNTIEQTGSGARIAEILQEHQDMVNTMEWLKGKDADQIWKMLYRSAPGEIEANIASMRHFWNPSALKEISPMALQRGITVEGRDPFAIKNVNDDLVDRITWLSKHPNLPGPANSLNPLSPNYQVTPEFPIDFGKSYTASSELSAGKGAIDKFLSSNKRNEWIDVPEGKMYLRRSMRAIPGKTDLQLMLDVASIDFEKKGTGAFTGYLDHMEKQLLEDPTINGIWVENLLNDRLASFLERRGYQREPYSFGGPPTMYITKDDILRRDIQAQEFEGPGAKIIHGQKNESGWGEAPKAANWNIPPEIQRLMAPKPFMDRIWDNYIQHYDLNKGWSDPDSFLHSEPMWSSAQRLAEHEHIKESQAFSIIANEMYRRGGMNKFMSPHEAMRGMGEARGIKLVSVDHDPFKE